MLSPNRHPTPYQKPDKADRTGGRPPFYLDGTRVLSVHPILRIPLVELENFTYLECRVTAALPVIHNCGAGKDAG